jgi:ankyrin repeat protein
LLKLNFKKRFRWVFCQLETLRHCLPPSVRRTLDELPESLDETYERILKEIKKPNRDHARRLLQCLVVAFRPLKVKELAEALAVDFEDAEGIPKLNPDWRWEDEEQALLTSCSSLIAIVETYGSRVVQFSHFSVKEFLTSTRLADSRKDISHYHINLEPAHTVLAQVCMGVLLHPDGRLEDDRIWSFPPVRYAAKYWVMHARFKSASSPLQKAMEYLFDSDKPHFATWLKLHNIDIWSSPSMDSSSLSSLIAASSSDASPLYYTALCGFQDFVEHLVVKHPQHVKTNGGRYGTPLVAALAGRYFQTAKFLHDNGAHLDVRYKYGQTPLYSAACCGDLEMVQVLLGYEVDVNAPTDIGLTSLHGAASDHSLFRKIHNIVQSSPDVARILLEHGADVNAQSDIGSTALHVASGDGSVEAVRILLEHNADVNARTKDGSTPLHVATMRGSVEIVQMLVKHGANVTAGDQNGITPLQRAANSPLCQLTADLVRVLIEHGADINTRFNNSSTLLHVLAANGDMGAYVCCSSMVKT